MNRLLNMMLPVLLVTAIGCGPNKGTTQLPPSEEKIEPMASTPGLGVGASGPSGSGGAQTLSQ